VKLQKQNSILRKLKGFMLRNMPNMITCKEFDGFMVDYLDNELSDKQRSKFELHIRMCRECRQYLDAYQRTIEVSQAACSSADDAVPNDVPDDLVKAILKARKR